MTVLHQVKGRDNLEKEVKTFKGLQEEVIDRTLRDKCGGRDSFYSEEISKWL